MSFTSELAFAIEIARQAGQLIADARSSSGLERSYKNGNELVTNADLAADKLICNAIQERYPDHVIISEESAPDGAQLQALDTPLWIIDPIDGTVNYAHGHVQSAVSIAHARGGEVVAGAVYNPFLKEMFHAEKGGGAFLNERPISVSGKAELRKSLIATGFPYDKDNLQPLVARVAAVLENCADIRRLGSAALDICWLAAGRLDGYYENLSLWDFAAARLIALEAGAQCGHFTDLPAGTNPWFHCEDILISTPELYSELDALLRQATA